MDEALSNINQIGLLFTLSMGVLILALPRRFAAFPLIATACYITLGQVISIASLNFTMLRIIIFIGFARIIVRKELFAIRLHRIDTVLIAYVAVSVAAYLLLRNGSHEAIVSQLGFSYNTLGLYFVFRALIHDMSDIQRIFKMIALIMVPLAAAMLLEKATGRNLFAVFGGVPEFTMVRDGKLRSQGAFAHPILAGTFGATSMPFLLALWVREEKSRMIALLGIASALIITITPSSSGPAVAFIFVLIGTFMWSIRDHMRAVRWGVLLSLIGLHIVMKAPVWALIGKMSEIIGGTGWHRVSLIDAAIEHFGEWWLMGTDYTRHWMPTGVTWSEKHTDITNQFIHVGIQGGIFSLILFVAIIVLCYQGIGKMLDATRRSDIKYEFMIWCLGVSLSAHIASFTSVRYFDQVIVFWYLLIAMITAGLSSLSLNYAKTPDVSA